MVRTVVRNSIQFDVERVQELVNEKDWGLKEWAERADVSIPTLRHFLRGERGIKLRTVDNIVRPFGLTAADLIKNGKN